MNILKRLFADKRVKNLYHADFKDKCIPAIKFNGVQYYRFKDELDMPYGRYMYLSTFLQAVEMRMDLKTLNQYIEILEKCLSGGKGNIDIGKAHITLVQLKTRSKVVFDSDIAYSLASCIFFTDSEPLNTYSMEHNNKKINAWREADALDFFMLTPVKELLNLGSISIPDLMNYLIKTQPIMNELKQAMQTALSSDISTK